MLRRLLWAMIVMLPGALTWGQGMAQSGGGRLLIIGASYAAGWGTPKLQQFEVVNRGVGGQQTQDVLARFDSELAATQPGTVLIWGHFNNIARSSPESVAAAMEQAKSDYRAMVAKARAAGANVVLATEIPMAGPTGLVDRAVAWLNELRGKDNYRQWVNRHVGQVNDWLRAYAAQERLQLLDFAKAFSGEDQFRTAEYAVEDGSHVSAAGYAALTVYAAGQLANAPAGRPAP